LKRHSHRSTAALLIAVLALVASLGGGSYAAKLLTGKDIKNGSITAKDIKKKSLTGKQVKDKSLTGADLKDGTVGAGDLAAGTLESTMSSVRVAATPGADLATARSVAPQRVLFSSGPFTVYAKCYTDVSVPRTYAVIYAKSSVNGAVMASGTDYLGGGSDDLLNIATPEDERELETESASAGAEYWRSLFSLHAPDGTAVSGLATVGAKNGVSASGDGAYGAGDACLFSVDARSS
jgi:hypothetical protein